MKSLLIVEDEDMERRYLQKAAASLAEYSFEIYTAENGAAALTLFEKVHPDVVLTDIYMPVMDGLQLVERIRRIAPETVCYILTSYDYFAYAQRAIQIGIEDFVLKPISKTNLKALLASARQIVQERHSKTSLIRRINALEEKIEKDCFISIAMSADERLLEENLRFFSLEGSEEACGLLLKDEESLALCKRKLTDAGLVCVGGIHENRCSLFVFSKGTLLASQLEQIASLQAAGEILQVSETVKSPKALIEAWQRLIHSYEYRSACENISPAHQIEADLAAELAKTMMDGAERSESACQQAILTAAIRRAEELASLIPLGEFYALLKESLENLYVLRYGEDLHLSVLPTSRSSPDIASPTLFRALLLPVSRTRKNAALIRYRQAVAYIEANYQNQICLADIAESLHVSAYYRSKILNRTADGNVSDLIHAFRIEEAKRLIRTGEPLKSIAWKVGYRSPSYFSKNFRRCLGLSPREYREMYETFLSSV